ncbi:MAG: thiol peroxidase, partial [Chloroflexi bacterium]|nr:thiol peroxidase [Chloroflexota bacterium]
MKKLVSIVIVAASLLLLLSACSGQTGGVIERKGAITLEGKPLTLLGPELKVGQKAPDFSLALPNPRVELSANATDVGLAQSQGKVRLISVVPSVDTPVCDLQTKRFEAEANAFENVAFYTISMDLPFAQARYCGANGVTRMEVLSDYRDGSFGVSYGVLIKELRLLSRAIFIIDQNNTVKYVQYVKEISQPVDFDAALTALQSLIGVHSIIPAPSVTTTTTPKTPTATTVEGNQVGNLAPNFQLNNLAGQPVSLSNLRGKPVLINFWATWCPHCQAERPLIQQISDEWQSKGVVLLTIDIIGSRPTETPANLADFMGGNKYTFPVLLDVNMQVTKSYGIKFTPTNFMIDKDGIIREIRTGPYPSKAVLEESLNQLLA